MEFLNELIANSGISPGMWGYLLGMCVLGAIWSRGRK
jgi:hypothetical protein